MEDKLIKEYFEQVNKNIDVPADLKYKLLSKNSKRFIIFGLVTSFVFSMLVITTFFEVASLIDPFISSIVLP